MVTRSILWSEKLGNSQQLNLYKLHFKGIMHTVATIIVILHQIKFSDISSFIKFLPTSEMMHWNLEWNAKLKT